MDLFLGQLLAMKALQVITSALQTHDECGLDLLPCCSSFRSADAYVVQLHTVIPQPLLSLVVASALSVDTALKQDSRGLN